MKKKKSLIVIAHGKAWKEFEVIEMLKDNIDAIYLYDEKDTLKGKQTLYKITVTVKKVFATKL